MAEDFNMKLYGPQAIAAIAIVVAIALFKFSMATKDLETSGVKELRTWIALDFQQYYQARYETDDSALSRSFDLRESFQFKKLSMRGGSGQYIVRVELLPHPDFPPGTELVQYHSMQHSSLTGWQYKNKVKPFSYTLALLSF